MGKMIPLTLAVLWVCAYSLSSGCGGPRGGEYGIPSVDAGTDAGELDAGALADAGEVDSGQACSIYSPDCPPFMVCNASAGYCVPHGDGG